LSAQPTETPRVGIPGTGHAEALIETLTGVLSSRIVTGSSGEIEEVHVLTTEEVSPKQTVRNVESALLAHLDMPLDHRKISVAQTSRRTPERSADEGTVSLVVERAALPKPDGRILYTSHRTETESSNQTKVTVQVEFRGEEFSGEAGSADLPRARLEAAAKATLRAVEAAARDRRSERADLPVVALSLDGVRVVSAFERDFTLVSVHALAGRDIVALSGSSVVNDRVEAAVIMATLQATDRWVRGRME
jgi:hypothetical protein